MKLLHASRMNRSLKNIALIVSLGTLISKFGGLARQLLIAGAFGVGGEYDAYNYAYVIPGFFLILLGGINGPFHNAMVSVLSKRTKEESSYVLASVSSLISLILFFITVNLIIFSDQIIYIIAPGLASNLHKIAVIQLQIMAPIAFLSGLIGLSFGALNANDEFFIPSISPIVSSLTIIIFVGLFWLNKSPLIHSIDLEIKGGMVLALATLTGAFLQWSCQLPYLVKKGLLKIRLKCDWKHPAVKEVLGIIAPATLSSGMLQINVFTDLFFASGILGAAAGLSYATFLVQAPLGLISNTLLIPLLPTFSRLKGEENRKALIQRIHQGLMLSSASMVALGVIFIALATPIVALCYGRGAFQNDAIKLVAGLLIAYGIGMPAYLVRDLLVRVFYSLNDGKTPFKISLIAILLNIFLDWALVGGPTPWGNQLPFNLGAIGLLIATFGVNLFSCTMLLLSLNNKLRYLPLKNWIFDISKIMVLGLISYLIISLVDSSIDWPENVIGLITEIILSATPGIFAFVFLGKLLGIKEINDISNYLTKKIIHL